MTLDDRPFVGSEAVANGLVRKHQLRGQFRAVFPDVYVRKDAMLTLRQRAVAGWLWSHRLGVVSGLTASALHGAHWVDDSMPVELVWPNARAPRGLQTRHIVLLDDEYGVTAELPVTTPERTAFDIGRRGRLGDAVARLDALAHATGVKAHDIVDLAARHRGARGIRQLGAALDLLDAGAASPRETSLRLLLIRAGFPRPQTQIPVLGPDGYPKYFLDMGWEEIKLAVEYDGEQHRTDPLQFAHDIERQEYLAQLDWIDIRVASRHRPTDVIRRVRRAWDARTSASLR